PMERFYPETGAIQFLKAQEGRVAGIGQALRPNAAIVYGLFDPRGDDPVKLERYEAVYSSFAPGDPVFFEPIQRWDHPWLDQLGVRWVVAGPREEMPWPLAYQGADARVYERPGAQPLVRWTETPGTSVKGKMIHPGFWQIAWRTPRRATLVVAETWDRGWHSSQGSVVPVDSALLGIELGPGEGTLELRYRPPGLVVGAVLSVLGVLAVLFVPRRRPVEKPSPPPTEIRPTQPSDLPSLSRLFADRFGHTLEPDEWDWKYRHLPGEARSFVAVQDGEVVAHAGALCLPARWQGGEGGIWQLVDFVGTPKRGGLRPPLVELGRALLHDLPREQDAPWIYGFPSERHFKLGQRVFGYYPLLEIQTFSGPIPEGSSEVKLEIGDSGGEWERPGVLGVRRTAAFLHWRYWARPRRYYRFYRWEDGFAVFAFVGEEAWAAELWGATHPVMLSIAADLRASGLRTWKFWSDPGSLGLLPDERRFVGCRGKTGDPAPLAAGFTYSMGDYDLV
ncbi:MAG TPA: hypothetical protein VFR31_02300, partial [Thermoanaerobaculia bacterium]|nr:hypothetical protein [Thermoanaerobaculia bacterium]